MDNGAVGAGLILHGLRNRAIEITGMERNDLQPRNARPSSWETRNTLCGALPRHAGNDDKEDYMAGLAEEIALCMLRENDNGSRALDCPSVLSSEAPWGVQGALSTSPQSTLAGMSSWDLLSPGACSSGGISSGVSSPPTPVASAQVRNEKNDALDILYAELLRLKMEDEIMARQQHLIQLKQQQHYQELLWKVRQRQAASLSYEAADAMQYVQGGAQYAGPNAVPKACSNSALYYRSKPRNDEVPQGRARKPSGGWVGNQNQGTRQKNWSASELSNQGQSHFAAYAPSGSQHKAVNGSGMRAVFLGNPAVRESGGTGVFLPRRLGSGHDYKRKPACSTVLLPSRIVQALNLNVEDTLVSNTSPTGVFHRRDSLSARVKYSSVAAEAVDVKEEWAGRPTAACSALQEVAPDICLPTEWTY